MPHLHTGPGQHDFTASAFIVRTDGSEPTIVLHNHRKLSKLLQFGGHIELDETPWQGLVRELREEAGFEVDQLSVLQPSLRFTENFPGVPMHPLPFVFNTHRYSPIEDHFHSDLTYAIVAAQPPRHAIADGESASIQLFTASQLMALPSSDIYNVTRSSALFVLEQLLTGWEVVPAGNWPL